MKNVLLDLHRVGKNPFNGLYTYCYQLGLSFLKLPCKGIRLNYYLPKEKFGLFGPSVNYIDQRSSDKFYKFNTKEFDIWHSTTTVSWYKPFNRQTKFIFTIHDLNFLIEDKINTERNTRVLKQIQQRVDRADHIIAISNFALRQAREYLQLHDKPITIVYPGCSFLNNIPTSKPPAHLPGKPFLFSIGLLEPRKNFHVLMPLLKHLDMNLVIAGLDKHHYKDTIISEARRHGVMGKLHLTGPVSEGEKVWYYQHCQAFMFPSFAEGFGLPIVEAMYYGKPVFLSREASLPEIGGDAAYYFDSFEPDAMLKNFTAGMQHFTEHQPIEKIKARAGLFSYDAAAQAFLNIYQTIS
jgi:glycosyltransferase involved in cell wall biosynthesis